MAWTRERLEEVARARLGRAGGGVCADRRTRWHRPVKQVVYELH
jgi:hypothetical protein